jgi:hypothetical protein
MNKFEYNNIVQIVVYGSNNDKFLLLLAVHMDTIEILRTIQNKQKSANIAQISEMDPSSRRKNR